MERLLVKTFLAVDTAHADEVATMSDAMTMMGPLFLPRLCGGCSVSCAWRKQSVLLNTAHADEALFRVFNFSVRYLQQLSGIWMIEKFAFYCTQANLCT